MSKRSDMPWYPQPIAASHDEDRSGDECMYSTGNVGGEKNRGITIREKIFIELCQREYPDEETHDTTDKICRALDRMWEKR